VTAFTQDYLNTPFILDLYVQIYDDMYKKARELNM